MDFNSLLPLLKILTSPDGQKIFFFLVVSLTTVVAVIRIVLRKDLENLISQAKKLISEKDVTLKHPIIQEAEKRIDTYENRADKFKASVIIDQIYSRNKLGIASRDSWDFVCRSFPNVLISLGLLGTFVGITSNLSSIQGILRNSTGTTEQITARLQEPLNGMATAFGSSLIALVCGIALTFVNLIFNTTVAKYRFLSLLEDYLNSKAPSTPTGAFLTEIQGSLRSFRQEMVSIFKNEISQAIGNSFTSQIAQITEENRRLTANLNSLVSGFRDSATQISDSSQAFQYAAGILSNSDLPNSVNNFSDTIEKVTITFEGASRDLVDSSNKIQEATQKLDIHSEEFTKLNLEISRLMEITQNNQESLLNTMPIMKQESLVLSDTVDLIRVIQADMARSGSNLNDQSDNLVSVKNDLIRLTKNVNSLTEKITKNLYNGLDFNILHEDNQRIIDLLKSLISNSSLNIGDVNNPSESTFSLEMLDRLEQIIKITSQVNDYIQSINFENNTNSYDQNKELASLDLEQINQAIESITAIKLGILGLQRLTNKISEQVILISNSNEISNETSLFPTMKKVLSKRIIGN